MKAFSTFLLPAVVAALMLLLPPSSAFSPSVASLSTQSILSSPRVSSTKLFKISDKRKAELGIGEGEDEYDLGKALENNTDPLISKIVAGSFILVMISLLVVGVIIPYTTDYGEGVCNPLLTAGRC